MSEEAQEVEKPAAPEITPPEPEKAEPEKAEATEGDGEGDGKQFIDFKSLPPQVEARFRRIYGNMKEYERSLQESAKVNRALVERLEKLESGDFDRQMSSLQQRQKEAFENGDFEQAQKINDELIDYKMAAKERARQKPTQAAEPKFDDGGGLTQEQEGLLAAWASETDASGNLVRPWANPKHAQHQRAMSAIQSAALDPDLFNPETGEGFEKVLEAVDGKMGRRAPSTPAAPAVLSGNGDARPKDAPKQVRLTAEQQRVAENMGYTHKQYADLIQKYGVK